MHHPRCVAARSGFALPLALSALLTVAAPAARSDTFVIPHVLERSGSINLVQYSFDTNLLAFYGSGLAGSPPGVGESTVHLYLYDNSAGNPMVNNGAQVCNPCTFYLGDASPRKASISVDDLIVARGGSFDAQVKLGFAVLVVDGDPDGVSLETAILNSHTSPFDLSYLSGAPFRLRSEDPAAPNASVFQMTHVLEKAGTITNTQYTFDHTLYAVYTAGLAGTAPGAGASIDLYLYDHTGNLPLQNNGQNVCQPCSFPLGGANPRKLSIRIDDLITAKGAFDATVKLGSAILVVNGDAGNVALQSFVVNSHTSAFDLSMSSPPVEPVHVGQGAAVLLEPRPGAVSRLGVHPSPASSDVRFAVEMARGGNVELAIFDVAGRKVATVFEGQLEAGARELRWNGSSPTGRLEGGVYFARLTSADGSSLARVVMRP